jgi:hypothetical protein
MQVRTTADVLWFTTTHLQCHGDKGISYGTGFFYARYVRRGSTGEEGPVLFLVTNRHIAEDAKHRMLIHLIRGSNAGPTLQPVLGERVGINLSEPLEQFVFHPDPTIDVAVLPFTKLLDDLWAAGGSPFLQAGAPEQMLTAEAAENLDSIEQVIIVGYPDGLYDRHNLTPIVRTGTTASPIRLDYEGRPAFLIDAPIFPGSSGSPVFLLDRTRPLARMSDGSTSDLLLLGIVAAAHLSQGAGRRHLTLTRGRSTSVKAGQLLDLGIVYKASTIDECVDAICETHELEQVPTPPQASDGSMST